jgi:excisionase family DNA binding protein
MSSFNGPPAVPAAELLTELVSLPEAAEYLGLHRATVNDMIISGRLRGYRLGAHWYVRRPELEIFKRAYRRPRGSPRRGAVEASAYWTQEILRWLLHWSEATSAELDRVLDLHVGNIRKYLALAEKDSLVTRDEYGLWSLTGLGLAQAARLPAIEGLHSTNLSRLVP